jgi:sulfoxide reductase heme-binding subunit YedZ
MAIEVRAARRRPTAFPWRDRQGRFSWLKAGTLAGCIAPGVALAYWLATGQAGARPITEALHETGLWTIRFLMIALAITPARIVLDWPKILLVRRMVGVAAAAYGFVHLSFFVVDQNFRLVAAASEIIHRFYLTIGLVALVGLFALAATSTDAAVRRMGKNWKRLHRAAYAIAVLGLFHYTIQSKANVGEPIVFAGLFVWLMLWRLLPERLRGRPALYPALALASALIAGGLEFAWYDIATRINAWRLLAADQTLRFGLRPAHWVAIATLAIFAVALLARIRPRRRPVRPPMRARGGARA